jgi:hypothetical protein
MRKWVGSSSSKDTKKREKILWNKRTAKKVTLRFIWNIPPISDWL